MSKEKNFTHVPIRVPVELHRRAASRLGLTGGKFQGLFIRLLTEWLEKPDAVPAQSEESPASEDPEREELHRKLDEVLDSRNEKYSQTVRGSIELIHEAMKSRR